MVDEVLANDRVVDAIEIKVSDYVCHSSHNYDRKLTCCTLEVQRAC